MKIPTLFQKTTASFLSLIGRISVKSTKVESSAAIPLTSPGPATTISSIPSVPAASPQLYSAQAAQAHAATAVAPPPVVTSAVSPIDLDSHNPNREIILAASAASAVSESQASERLMLEMIAGPAVSADELTALLAAATLAHRSAAPLPPVRTTPMASVIPASPSERRSSSCRYHHGPDACEHD